MLQITASQAAAAAAVVVVVLDAVILPQFHRHTSATRAHDARLAAASARTEVAEAASSLQSGVHQRRSSISSLVRRLTTFAQICQLEALVM